MLGKDGGTENLVEKVENWHSNIIFVSILASAQHHTVAHVVAAHARYGQAMQMLLIPKVTYINLSRILLKYALQNNYCIEQKMGTL